MDYAYTVQGIMMDILDNGHNASCDRYMSKGKKHLAVSPKAICACGGSCSGICAAPCGASHKKK